MEKKEYIKNVLEYTKKNKISIYDYYHDYAYKLRNHETFKLQPFELKNPFIKPEDIGKLLTSPDDQIVEYYAYVMSKTVSDNNITREDVIEVLNDDLDGKVILTSINKKLADTMNGFAVVKEEKTGRVHLYYYDVNSDSLKGEQVYLNNSVKVDSGYFINFEEYIDNMLNELLTVCPNPDNMAFVRDDGLEKTLPEVLEEVYAILKQRGAMRYGQELFKETINNYEDLNNLNTNYTEDYAGEPLRVGVYVRRGLITRFFAKYKVRMNTLEKENNTIKK